jgi:hypothetical protein
MYISEAMWRLMLMSQAISAGRQRRVEAMFGFLLRQLLLCQAARMPKRCYDDPAEQ